VLPPRHPPFASAPLFRSLADAIERARVLLAPVKAGADVVIDTTELNVHQLKARIGDLFGGDPRDHAMQITVESFGFKHGLPLDRSEEHTSELQSRENLVC